MHPTILIGFGGGTAIDTAKGIIYFSICGKVVSQKPFFIAIPTTSGTGSEMTAFAVLTDTQTRRKLPVIDDTLYPDLAILDPHLVLSVPPSVTANTGFDVITHDPWSLNNGLLRRDEIWFTEKDKDGVSSVYSLVDFVEDDKKIRKDENYEKNYLLGKYGAIPYLKPFIVAEEQEDYGKK